MYYLLYQKDGLIKKYPLDKPEISIGRGRDNNIILTEKAVSKRHCLVRPLGGELAVIDLDSRNGTFVDGCSIGEARIAVNHSFCIEKTPFFLKKGEAGEFTVSPALSILYSLPNPCRRSDNDKEPETDPVNNRLDLALRSLAEKSLVTDSRALFLKRAGSILSQTLTSGTLVFFYECQQHILVNHLPLKTSDLMGFDFRALPAEADLPVQGRIIPVWKYRSELPSSSHFLCYLNPKPKRSELPPPRFFKNLLEIIEVHLKLTASPETTRESGSILYQDDRTTIIGESPELKTIVGQAKRFASRDSFIIILGESGTGKELFARMIHRLSGRKNFVAINCAAIPAPLLESELFGYEKGAFTDARERTIGKIEASSGGTLVLDEIGDMPPEIQAKLLRVIQEKSITRLGGHETIPVDLRIIAMTNQDLAELVKTGAFRRDLFFRLLVHQFTVPPLRRREEDVPLLIRHFSDLYARKNGVTPAGFTKAAEEALVRYSWPGNVRELENEIRRIMETVDDGEMIGGHHLRPDVIDARPRILTPEAGTPSLDKPSLTKDRIRAWERQEVEELLRKNLGNKSKTAREMSLTYRGFLKKLKRLGLY
ncbi:MAG: sigma 54-interacting transcriptional regulator [Candidatus Aminicenantes bacterium]|nr:sigma 54-interacting transcriptional regulator [Candidatus Aminicenantes bacterium]